MSASESDARAAARPPARRPQHPRLVLTTCILASSLAFVDGSVVNVGLPAIGRGLNAEGSNLSFVVNGYLLPLGALLLLGGAAGDLYGRRRLLVSGTAIFAATSLACAAAPSFWWLVAARLAQGAGAAVLLPNSLAILGTAFQGEERGRAVGIWAAAGAAGGAVGPLLGGWLVDAVGWRSIFLVNLPIAAAAIVLALRYVPPQEREAGPPLDAAGGALASAGLGLLTLGLTFATSRLDARSAAALLGGVLLLVAFGFLEKRKGDRAMMPLALFSSRAFAGLSVLTFLLYGALGAVIVLIPYVLIVAGHASALAAGAALLPLPAMITVASPAMGRLAARGASRRQLCFGPLIAAAGLALAARIDGASFASQILPAMIVLSLGMAVAVAPLTTAVLGSVEVRHTGIASGFNSAVARTGGLTATALVSGVFAAHGHELLSLYRTACFASALAAALAGASAFAGLRQSDARNAA
jgi:EmrB/QacA subfamily drug resistance transporter